METRSKGAGGRHSELESRGSITPQRSKDAETEGLTCAPTDAGRTRRGAAKEGGCASKARMEQAQTKGIRQRGSATKDRGRKDYGVVRDSFECLYEGLSAGDGEACK